MIVNSYTLIQHNTQKISSSNSFVLTTWSSILNWSFWSTKMKLPRFMSVNQNLSLLTSNESFKKYDYNCLMPRAALFQWYKPLRKTRVQV